MKKIPLIPVALLIVGTSIFCFRGNIQDSVLGWKKRQQPTEAKTVSTPPMTATSTEFTGIDLDVPFSTQAPYGDWGVPYMEACEETSALLVDRFYKNEEITPEIAKQEILKMVDWENRTFGDYKHTTAEETGRMLKEYFGYKRVDVLYDISLEDVKAQIMAGRPVIAPLARPTGRSATGRMLGNPFYREPGPIYHMLVIKGITKDGKFITNDVGTTRGHDYVYDAQVLYDTINDSPFGDVVSRKAIIVVYPN